MWDAIKAWKKDHFSPMASKIMTLNDAEFVSAYEQEFDNTVQHELSEVIEYIDAFVTAHGDDIFSHYELLKKYRKLTGPDKTIIILR